MHRSPRTIVALGLISLALVLASFTGVRAAAGLLNDLPLLGASFVPQANAGLALQSTPAVQPTLPAGPIRVVQAKHPASVKTQSTLHLDAY